MRKLVYQQAVSFQINPSDLPLLSFSAPPLEVGLRCLGLTFIKGMIAKDVFDGHLSGWQLDKDLLQPDGLYLHQPGGSAVVLRGTIVPEDPNVVLDVIPSCYDSVVQQATQKHPVFVGASADDAHVVMALLPDTGRLYRFKGVVYVYDSLDIWPMDIVAPSARITYEGVLFDSYPMVAVNACGSFTGRIDFAYNPLEHVTVATANGRLVAPWGSASFPTSHWRVGSLQDFIRDYDLFAPWSEGRPVVTSLEASQDPVPAQIEATFPESTSVYAEWPDGALAALQGLAKAGAGVASMPQWLRSLDFLDVASVRGVATHWPPTIDAEDYPADVPFFASVDQVVKGQAAVSSIASSDIALPFLVTRIGQGIVQVAALFSGFGWKAGVPYQLGISPVGDTKYADIYVAVEGEAEPRVYHRDVTGIVALPAGARRIVSYWYGGSHPTE